MGSVVCEAQSEATSGDAVLTLRVAVTYHIMPRMDPMLPDERLGESGVMQGDVVYQDDIGPGAEFIRGKS